MATKINKEIAIGIDIGTSYIKGSARTIDGLIISTYRKRTSVDVTNELIFTTKWWDDAKEVISGILSNCKDKQSNIIGICVSAIAPTLTVFDAENPNEAYSILYSTLPKKKSTYSQYDQSLTNERLAILRDIAIQKQFAKPCITDLVGYINYRLTNKLTINSISLCCLGTGISVFDNKELCINDRVYPNIVSVVENIGVVTEHCLKELDINSEIFVCGGCSDVFGSVLGSGIKNTEDRMIYLGTFGTLLKLEQEIEILLESKIIKTNPFNLKLSVPGFAKKIEEFSKEWCNNSLKILDKKAAEVSPGADGTIFLLPRWKNGMIPIGNYEFVSNNNSERIDLKSRAILESIGYAICLLEQISTKYNIYVSGGGAQSQIWLDIISIVLQNDVKTLQYSWESAGTADIAGRMYWGNTENLRTFYTSKTEFDKYKEGINSNCHKIKEYYYDKNWL